MVQVVGSVAATLITCPHGNVGRAATSKNCHRAASVPSLFAGTDPLTKKHRYLRETAKTYAAAKVALTKLQGQVDDEMHPKTNITVSQAIDQWLDVARLAETTRDRYDDLIRIYIRPTFGDLPAAKLDAEILERFYARLQRCRTLCDGRTRRGHICQPLSGSTVRQIHQIIRLRSNALCGGGISA